MPDAALTGTVADRYLINREIGRGGMAAVYLARRAIELLERVADAGYSFSEWMRQDPDLEPLHGNPRFEAILTKLQRNEEQ